MDLELRAGDGAEPSGIEHLDPCGAPRGRVPRLAEVDALAHDLLVPELHDPDGHDGPVVVVDRVLVDPQVVASGDAVHLEALARRIGRPEADDVRPAADALAALRPLDHGVLGVDLGRPGDGVAGSAPGGADVRRVEVRLDQLARPCPGHRTPPAAGCRPWTSTRSALTAER